MSVFRGRRPKTKSAPTPDFSPPGEPRPGEGTSPAEAPRFPNPQPAEAAAQGSPESSTSKISNIESTLITLTKQVEQCIERLDALERRVDELAEATLNAPSHSDVLEVRMHSAKLAAELARSTVELRGEIGMAGDEVRRAARANRLAPAVAPATELPSSVDPYGQHTIGAGPGNESYIEPEAPRNLPDSIIDLRGLGEGRSLGHFANDDNEESDDEGEQDFADGETEDETAQVEPGTPGRKTRPAISKPAKGTANSTSGKSAGKSTKRKNTKSA